MSSSSTTRISDMMVLPLYSSKGLPWAKGMMRDFTFEVAAVRWVVKPN
jgi:hypothetical protein